MSNLCPDDEFNRLVQQLEADPSNNTSPIVASLRNYPEDPRLHFMLASLQVANRDHINAHRSFEKTMELAPEFVVARYQFGFFALTSGEPDRALSIWGPLFRLPEENYFRLLVEGMAHLIRDEFVQAIANFEAARMLNTENPPLNSDVALLIGECKKLMANSNSEPVEGSDDASATSLFLNQLAGSQSKH